MNVLRTLTNGEARKAIAAIAVPALIAIGGALLPGSDGGGRITGQEWIVVAVAGLSCGTVVYSIPNRPRKGNPDG